MKNHKKIDYAFSDSVYTVMQLKGQDFYKEKKQSLRTHIVHTVINSIHWRPQK